jgi:hypothetical protein
VARLVYAEAAQVASRNSAGDRALRNSRYKLHYDSKTKAKTLFDLLQDPGEQTDIAAEQPAVADSLFEYLEQFMLTDREGERMGTIPPERLKRLRALGYLQ